MAGRVVVIGGTAAGLSAASKAKRVDPSLEITVFEKSGYISYGACGLPYFVGGMIDEPLDLVSLTVDQMTGKRGIPTFIHHEVTKIDRDAKQVTVTNLDSGEVSVHPYDKLVIATGARPVIPPIPGVHAGRVHVLRTVEDGISLKAAAGKGGKAAIIGGGFIGIEVAEEMALSGIEVHLFEAMPRLLPFLQEEFSDRVLETLRTHGVQVHLSATVREVLTDNGEACGVRTDEGELPADIVLLSIGVRPASELAREAGLALSVRDAILVDDEMRTSDEDIYACGDCAMEKHIVTGQPVYIPLGTTANKQGRIAGGNLAGLHDRFKGVLGSMVTKAFDLTVAATGLSLQQARDAGYDAVSSVITKADRASYYPGGRDNVLCFILDSKSGRLLGAQGIGSESVAGRINVLATAITAGMTVAEINELDLVYAPPVAPVYDPILIAASQAMKKVKG